MQVNQQFVEISCILWEWLIKEQLISISKKPRKRIEILGGLLMSWMSVMKKRQKEKLLKLEEHNLILNIKSTPYSMLQVTKTMFQI